MSKPIQLNFRGMVALLGLLLCTGCDRREEYPNRPLTLICPWSAGGGTDRVSRQIASLLEQRLDVPVNVVNATGGGGVTGHTRGALARPDGYILTMITPELNLLHWRDLTSITYADFTPLMSVNGDAAALFVAADSEYQSPADVMAAITKASPRVRASGSAFGSIWHVAFAGWLQAEGLQPEDAIWVSLGGSAPALQELMAGGVDVVCASVPEAQSLLDAGKVRCLAVMGAERVPELPDVPTLQELGSPWTMTGWRGLALPNGVPEERRAILLGALREVVEGAGYREFLEKSRFGNLTLPPEEFQTLLEQSDQQFGAFLQDEAFQSVHKQRFGPMLFPSLIAGSLVIVFAWLLVSGGWKRSAAVERPTLLGFGRATIFAASVLSYVAFAELLGFVITGSVVLLVNSLALGAKRWVAILISLLIPPVAYQVFSVFMRVPLPSGWLRW